MRNRTEENHDIKSFQTYLQELYSVSNKNLTQEYIYGYLCRGVGYLCKAIRTKNPAPKDFVRPISWLFAFATKLDIDVLDAFVGRYPGVCPLCLEAPCVCMRTNKQPRRYTAGYEVQDELLWKKRAVLNSQLHKPGTLSLQNAVMTINTVYPNNEVIWHYAGGWYQFSKLQEEVAELHEAMAEFTKKRKPKEAVSVEVADALAWILGLWGVTMATRNLSKDFISYYIDGCPVCGRNPCTCAEYNSRPEGLVDMIIVAEIRDNMRALADELPRNREALDQVVASLTAAVESQNDSLARLSVNQAGGKLEELKKGLGNAAEVGKSTFSILETILHLIGKMPWS